jgi:hypothetical protein
VVTTGVGEAGDRRAVDPGLVSALRTSPGDALSVTGARMPILVVSAGYGRTLRRSRRDATLFVFRIWWEDRPPVGVALALDGAQSTGRLLLDAHRPSIFRQNGI